MSKKKITIPHFDQYSIDAKCISTLQLPNKIWSFIDSLNDQPFDMLDIAEFYSVDTVTSKKILDFLLQSKVCNAIEIENFHYDEWKEKYDKASKTVILESPDNTPLENTASSNSSEDSDITVSKHARDISLEIG